MKTMKAFTVNKISVFCHFQSLRKTDKILLQPKAPNLQTQRIRQRACYFLFPISIVFGSNFRNGDFDGFERFEVS